MSPAVVNRFPGTRSCSAAGNPRAPFISCTMLSFFAFIVVHVTLVVMTGFVRNMNHIVMGTDDLSTLGA